MIRNDNVGAHTCTGDSISSVASDTGTLKAATASNNISTAGKCIMAVVLTESTLVNIWNINELQLIILLTSTVHAQKQN